MSESNTPRSVTCARCGSVFSCSLSGDCWCAAEPFRLPITAATTEDCLCRECMRKAAAFADSHRAVREG